MATGILLDANILLEMLLHRRHEALVVFVHERCKLAGFPLFITTSSLATIAYFLEREGQTPEQIRGSLQNIFNDADVAELAKLQVLESFFT